MSGAFSRARSRPDLAVVQPTKFEFIVNLQTARTPDIKVPPTLPALGDEVIE